MSRSTSRRLVGALLVVMALGAARVEAAQTDKQVEINARQAFAAGRYDEAIELFAKLYAETLNPIYLRNIGRCHQKQRQPDKAIDAFHDYLAKGKGISSAERKEIQGYIHEMELLRDEEAKRIVAQPNPPPPALAVNTNPSNEAAPPPPPPPSNLSLGVPPPPPDGAPGAQVTIAQEGAPANKPHPFYTRWWFWTVVGVVAVGAAAVVLVSASGTTKPGCPSYAFCK
jgi:hypothetical protein